MTAAKQALAIRRDGAGRHGSAVAQKAHQLRPGRQIPHHQRLIDGCGDQAMSVGHQSHGLDWPGVAAAAHQLDPGAQIPQLHHPLGRARDQRFSVGRQGTKPDSRAPTGGPGGATLCGHAHQLDHVVVRGKRQRRAAVAAGVPIGLPHREASLLQSRLHVRDRRHLLCGNRDQQLAVMRAGASREWLPQPTDGTQHLPRHHIPQLDRAVHRAREQLQTVGRQPQRVDRALMTATGGELALAA